MQNFPQKHMFAWQVIYDIFRDPLILTQILEMNKEENRCSELSEKTMDILDNDILVNLFVSTQRTILICVLKRAFSE